MPKNRRVITRARSLVTALVLIGLTAEAVWPSAAESERPAPVLTAAPVVAAFPAHPHALRILAVRAEALRVGISPDMALAVSFTENWGGDSLAVSRAGAVGVMQIMPRVWGKAFIKECGEAPLTNLRRNACVGVRVLAHYRARYGNWNQALRAYNGSLRYRLSGDRYVASVMRRLSRFNPSGLTQEGRAVISPVVSLSGD